MTKKRQWFLLGMLGAVVGMAVRLVRGRRQEEFEAGRWEEFQPPSGGWQEPARPEEAAS